MTAPGLGAAMRACAAGLYPAEADVSLLIRHGTFLHRGDFTSRFIQHGTSISDGSLPPRRQPSTGTRRAPPWTQATFPCSGERRILRLAASLAAGIPSTCRTQLTGLDERNIRLLLAAIAHASGRRPSTWEARDRL